MASGALNAELRSAQLVLTTATTLLTSIDWNLEPGRSPVALIGIATRLPCSEATERMSCIPSIRSSCHSLTSRMIFSALSR